MNNLLDIDVIKKINESLGKPEFTLTTKGSLPLIGLSQIDFNVSLYGEYNDFGKHIILADNEELEEFFQEVFGMSDEEKELGISDDRQLEKVFFQIIYQSDNSNLQEDDQEQKVQISSKQKLDLEQTNSLLVEYSKDSIYEPHCTIIINADINIIDYDLIYNTDNLIQDVDNNEAIQDVDHTVQGAIELFLFKEKNNYYFIGGLDLNSNCGLFDSVLDLFLCSSD